MIDIQSFHHVAVSVTDLARARGFYSGVLGLRELPRPTFDVDGVWYQLSDGQLHLIVYPPTRTLRGTHEIDLCDGHVALRVTSYDETIAHLQAHGIPFLERAANPTTWQQLYVTDPDGNIVEFTVDRTGPDLRG
jgi:catechol 2,3-dioxygenase-like lactoylglutathione lyase family enzyme